MELEADLRMNRNFYFPAFSFQHFSVSAFFTVLFNHFLQDLHYVFASRFPVLLAVVTGSRSDGEPSVIIRISD